MANFYAINGTAASLAPFKQTWRKVEIGVDHNGAPIFSGFKEIDLEFDAASITYHRQWTDLENGASHTLDVLNEQQLGYVTLSPVYIRITERPATQSAVSMPMKLTILKVP